MHFPKVVIHEVQHHGVGVHLDSASFPKKLLDRFFSTDSEKIRHDYHAPSPQDDDEDGAAISSAARLRVSAPQDRA
jgi:hypothetical protein